jgi:hypothetical protein
MPRTSASDARSASLAHEEVLSAPPDRRNLRLDARDQRYDVAVIGCGPSGLAAAALALIRANALALMPRLHGVLTR